MLLSPCHLSIHELIFHFLLLIRTWVLLDTRPCSLLSAFSPTWSGYLYGSPTILWLGSYHWLFYSPVCSTICFVFFVRQLLFIYFLALHRFSLWATIVSHIWVYMCTGCPLSFSVFILRYNFSVFWSDVSLGLLKKSILPFHTCDCSISCNHLCSFQAVFFL